MNRPKNIENLLKIHVLKEAVRDHMRARHLMRSRGESHLKSKSMNDLEDGFMPGMRAGGQCLVEAFSAKSGRAGDLGHSARFCGVANSRK